MLRNRLYLSIVGSHFAIDMFTGICGVLLAVLAGTMGLSNTQIGTAVTLYMLAGSISQPLFGWLADKLPEPDDGGFSALHLVSISIVWMVLFFSLVAFTSQWGMVLTFLMLASLGSGLFHPIGTGYVATLKSASANTWTAVFFLGGASGLALGPMLAGIVFDMLGVAGVVPLSMLALIPALLMWLALRSHQTRLPASATTSASVEPSARELLVRVLRVTALAFFLLVALRSSIQATYQFFIPKLFADQGWDPALYGLLAGVYMGTAAIGNVIIGRLTDHVGMRFVSVVSLLISVPMGLLFLTTPSLPLMFGACALAGVLTGGHHSIFVVHTQQLLPLRKGLAAGVILGFTFATGALGAWVCSIAADSYGLQHAMLGVVLLGIPASLLALTLPGRMVEPTVAVVETQSMAHG